MSAFQYPRHVKDLPKLEVESEDDSNTPHLKQNINNKEKFVFLFICAFFKLFLFLFWFHNRFSFILFTLFDEISVMCNKENIDLQSHEENTPDDDHRQQAASYNLMV